MMITIAKSASGYYNLRNRYNDPAADFRHLLVVVWIDIVIYYRLGRHVMDRQLLDQAVQLIHTTENIATANAIRLNELGEQSALLLKESRHSSSRKYYYSQQPGSSHRKYLGTDANKEVRRIKEAHFRKALDQTARSNINVLQELISEYKPIDFNSINESVPAVYRCNDLQMSDLDHSIVGAAENSLNWKALREKEKSAYLRTHSERHPENLTARAADGTILRSKSEVIIADLLFFNGIPYIYEYPVSINGKVFRIDFLALSIADSRTEVMIEHQGMMNMPQYRQKYINTLLNCLDTGITPNVDIFFTFDDLHGDFDTRQIMDIIRTRLLPQNNL